jgi:hypothetical protein
MTIGRLRVLLGLGAGTIGGVVQIEGTTISGISSIGT